MKRFSKHSSTQISFCHFKPKHITLGTGERDFSQTRNHTSTSKKKGKKKKLFFLIFEHVILITFSICSLVSYILSSQKTKRNNRKQLGMLTSINKKFCTRKTNLLVIKDICTKNLLPRFNSVKVSLSHLEIPNLKIGEWIMKQEQPQKE